MGCYEAINYKEADWKKKVSAALKRKDGKGRSNGFVDVYFDNGKISAGYIASGSLICVLGIVGGEMLDFMLGRLNEFARVVMCGAISDYSKHTYMHAERSCRLMQHVRLDSAKPYPIRSYQSLISTKSKLEGFIVFQFYKRYPEGRKFMAQKLKSGELKYDYTVLGKELDGKRGVEACVDGLIGLYEGKNTGKT